MLRSVDNSLKDVSMGLVDVYHLNLFMGFLTESVEIRLASNMYDLPGHANGSCELKVFQRIGPIIVSVNSSKQAIRMRSGVAGVSRGNQSDRPSSLLADIMASLMAKKTDEARKNGGSPTALDE
ncbi:hypothetical protein Leryth_022050 [Lithospermum erythrorhizon]|nr:hypothetical protein Leryth_022050 [Lithospermum erythrorhizon]